MLAYLVERELEQYWRGLETTELDSIPRATERKTLKINSGRPDRTERTVFPQRTVQRELLHA